MAEISHSISHIFGNQLRLRVCGICIQDEQILLINHAGLNKINTFWSPPGGGCQFGETAPDALIREFREETHLEIKVKGLLFVNEFLRLPLHAIELFFEVEIIGGQLTRGIDPEMMGNEAIIQEVRWVSFYELSSWSSDEIHSALYRCQSVKELSRRHGYIGGGEV